MLGLRKRQAPPTRAWVTISMRRVDPSGMLERVAESHGLRVLESIAFDGASAAVRLGLPSLERSHAPGSRIELDLTDRGALRAFLVEIHKDRTVQDVVFETHVGGVEDVTKESMLGFDALLDRIEHQQLRAGVRYVTD